LRSIRNPRKDLPIPTPQRLRAIASPDYLGDVGGRRLRVWTFANEGSKVSHHLIPRRTAMAKADWRLEGEWIKNCNCAFGCPCDFNARPSAGYCKGLVAMHIKKGHFNKTKLDGLKFVVTVDFPGALHEGNGTIQPIIEQRATPEQREALFGILTGKNSAEGTIFNI